MKDFMLIGHRGACYYEPENTLASFKKALQLKCKFIETDARLSKDKKVILIHDKTLDRTTNGKGLVSKLTLKELKKLDAGKGEKIPTLQDLIDLTKDKSSLVIELKKTRGITDGVLKIIKRNKIEDKVLIVSFHSSHLKKVKRLNPSINVGLLSVRPIFAIKRAKFCKANLIGIYHNFLTENFIKKAHKKNFKVFSYERITENLTKKEIKKLIIMGLDGIALNKPIL